MIRFQSLCISATYALTALMTLPSHAGLGGGGFGSPPTIPGGGGGFNPPMATLYSGGVETPYTDLQAAIDDAIAGDRIELEGAEWPGGLFIDNKHDLEITSATGGSKPIINGGDVDRGVVVTNSSNISFDSLAFQNCVSPVTAQPGLPTDRGGAILCLSTPGLSVTNCSFTANIAGLTGGAVAMDESNNANFSLCRFDANGAGGPDGGAISCKNSDGLRLYSCDFIANLAPSGLGGAVALDCPNSATALISRCMFESNSARMGGAVLATGSYGTVQGELLVEYCTFSRNRVTQWGGGAIYLWGPMYSEVTASMFLKNHGVHGGGISINTGTMEVTNCLFAGNRGSQGDDHIDVTAGGTISIGNSQTDCQSTFANSVRGTWTDAMGNSSLPHCGYTADINFDGEVGVGDLIAVLAQWGADPQQDADIARSPGQQHSVVEHADLMQVIQAWGDRAEL